MHHNPTRKIPFVQRNGQGNAGVTSEAAAAPLLSAWALRFSIPYNSIIDEDTGLPPRSLHTVIRLHESWDIADLMRLFLDEAPMDENAVDTDKAVIAEQYCRFLKELHFPENPTLFHHLHDVILAHSDMCIPSSIVHALNAGIPYYGNDSIMNAIFQSKTRSPQRKFVPIPSMLFSTPSSESPKLSIAWNIAGPRRCSKQQ